MMGVPAVEYFQLNRPVARRAGAETDLFAKELAGAAPRNGRHEGTEVRWRRFLPVVTYLADRSGHNTVSCEYGRVGAKENV